MAFEKRDKRVMTNLTTKEHKKIEKLANRAGVKVSRFIQILIQEAR